MAKEEQKKQERRVLKQGDGGATIGGLLAVGGAIAAAAFLGALCKHAAKRINGKSLGDSPRGEVSEELNCKNREEESRGLRSLLQTSSPSVPKYQFQASHPREEEPSGLCPMPSVADEFVIAETLITEKEPASGAKQEGSTPITEEKYILSSTSDKDMVFVGNDTGFGEDGALAVVQEFSFPVVNPDTAGLDGTHVVYQEKEDLNGSSSLVLMPPSKVKEVQIGSQMISEEKDERKDGIQGIPMESEIEGGRDEESTLARDDSVMLSNIEQEKEEEKFMVVEPTEAKASESYLVKPEKEEAYPGAGNNQVEPIKEEEPYHGAGDYQVEPKEEKDKEEEAFDEAGNYEKEEEKEEAAFDEAGKDQVDGAGNYEVEPEVERETEEEAFDGAETYLVNPINEKVEKGEAYYGPGDYVVETNVEEEKEEGSETRSLDFSTESNVEEEKDGEGSDGTGDSSMESNAEVIWPAEFIEGLLQSKTLGDVTNEKQSESADHQDGQYEEKETEDTQEDDDDGEEEEEEEDGEGEEEEDGEEEEARDYLRKQTKENSSFETEGKAMTGRGLVSVTTRGKSWGFLSVSAVVGFFLFLLLSHLLAENYNFCDYFTSTVSASNR